MAELRALISCRLVWDDEAEVTDVLSVAGVSVDMPRFDGQQLEEQDLLPILGRLTVSAIESCEAALSPKTSNKRIIPIPRCTG